jgi:hypothetical protein
MDPEHILNLCRSILHQRGLPDLPERILPAILAELENRTDRAGMVLQLLHLAYAWTRHVGDNVSLVGRRLLYTDGVKFVTFGAHTYHAENDVSISQKKNGKVWVVDGYPCWIEIEKHTFRERVNRAGSPGKFYPPESIGTLLACRGGPCYAVNYTEGGGTRFGFVVRGEIEGERFRQVRDLFVDGTGEQVYVAKISDGEEALVRGKTRFATGFRVGNPVLVHGHAFCPVRVSEDPPRDQLWWDDQLIREADEIRSLGAIAGTVAFALYDAKSDRTEILIGFGSRIFDGKVDELFLVGPEGAALSVVCCVADQGSYSVYANHVFLCVGKTEEATLLEDGRTLSIKLRGEETHKTFDLAELGVI